MRKLVAPLVLLILIVAFQSCKDCKSEDTYHGLISGNITNYCPVSGAVIIKSEAQYDSVLHGEYCTPNPINYSIFSILGYGVPNTCMNMLDRRVTRDDSAKKYTYEITVYTCKCRKQDSQSYSNLVLVPKVPDGYTVDFVYREE